MSKKIEEAYIELVGKAADTERKLVVSQLAELLHDASRGAGRPQYMQGIMDCIELIKKGITE
jgi:hypothetical protein